MAPLKDESLATDGADGLRPPKQSFVIATLFLAGTIAFSIASQLMVVNRDKISHNYTNIFDSNCVNKLSDGAEEKFTLDITMGNFSFTHAKIIDITWDIAIAHGGRVLHGWVLYQHLLRLLLVVAMERSTVTYQQYIALSFSEISFITLWQAVKMLKDVSSWTILFCAATLVYPITYTLFFPAFWSTATGYLSQSHRLYAMPDGNMVPLHIEELSLCWVLDSERLGIQSGYIELGPNFASLGSLTQPIKYTDTQLCVQLPNEYGEDYFNYTMVYTSGGWRPSTASTIWDYFGLRDVVNSIDHTSDNFQSIRNYALSKQLLQMTLNPVDWLHIGAETGIFYQDGRESIYLDQWASGQPCPMPIVRNMSYIDGIQYSGPTQLGPLPHFAPYNETGFETTSNARFVSNFSTNTDDGIGIVPYNSTIRLNGRLFEVPSPFLDVGFGCSGASPFGSLGNCVCYKEEPVPLEIFSDERTVCNTAPGYVWGFSSHLTQLGLAFEAAWMACCFVCYSWLMFQCKLIRRTPIGGAGVLRCSINIAEAACNDLGSEALRLPEKDLMRKLKDLKIGYQTDESKEGRSLQYRIVSGLEDPGRLERLDRSAFGLKIM